VLGELNEFVGRRRIGAMRVIDFWILVLLGIDIRISRNKIVLEIKLLTCKKLLIY